MRLQIKTLNQKSLVIDIEDNQTVYDLKKELSMYPDVGVGPEYQKLVYAGKILSNNEALSTYKIDIKKFLVVMVLKQPEQILPEAASTSKTVQKADESEKQSPKTEEVKKVEPKVDKPSTPASAMAREESPVTLSRNEEMVENIVSMGYPESEVRVALEASFYNPERAIEYLIEGMPSTATVADRMAYEVGDSPTSPLNAFRHDPVFRDLRRIFRQNPELLNTAIQQIGEMYPTMLNLINENQQEFLLMLSDVNDSDDDSYESD